jgi:hypothetical protein
MRIAYTILVGNLEAKTLSERTRIRREKNSKIDLQEIRCMGVDGIELA